MKTAVAVPECVTAALAGMTRPLARLRLLERLKPSARDRRVVLLRDGSIKELPGDWTIVDDRSGNYAK